jgi:hypothetical protein
MAEPPRNPPQLGVAYFGNRYLDHARADFGEIAAMGASYVVHAASEADLRWNPGTMRDLVAAGREAGLTAWLTPWALGGMFGGEASSYAVMEHPEACQRDNLGQHLPALCPRQPIFRQLMIDWLDMAAESAAAICQWDEPHLARQWTPGDGVWACRCQACQEAFRADSGRDMPGEWEPEVADFVRRLVADTVRWLVSQANDRGLGSSGRYRRLARSCISAGGSLLRRHAVLGVRGISARRHARLPDLMVRAADRGDGRNRYRVARMDPGVLHPGWTGARDRARG